MGKCVDDKWLDPQVANRYCEWLTAWVSRRFHRMNRAIPQSEFIDRILATDFGNASSRGQFLWMMEMLNTPFCLIGEGTFGKDYTGYALDPGPAYLWPNKQDEDDFDLVHQSILGINLNVRQVDADEAERSRKDPLPMDRWMLKTPEGSTRRGNPRDTNRPEAEGFIFVQLGMLCAYSGPRPWAEVRTLGREAIIPNSWAATGFGVVLQINSRGRPGSVWVIYNFHTLDEDDGSHHHVPRKDTKTLPFTVAKIADRLEDLNHENARINFQIRATDERQIVGVRTFSKSSETLLGRQYVKRDIKRR